MNKYFLIIITGFLMFVTACSKMSEYDLEKSVYRPDATYASLPAYTEWGYNTFGAYYDRKLFLYKDSEIPMKVIHTGGATSLVFKGGLGEIDKDNYYYQESYGLYDTMILRISLKGFSPQYYEDLVELNDTLIDLTGPLVDVNVIINNDTIDMHILEGGIEIKKAQHLYVDKTPIKVILSGYFDFKALVKGEPVSMSYGRFDIGISEADFYSY